MKRTIFKNSVLPFPLRGRVGERSTFGHALACVLLASTLLACAAQPSPRVRATMPTVVKLAPRAALASPVSSRTPVSRPVPAIAGSPLSRTAVAANAGPRVIARAKPSVAPPTGDELQPFWSAFRAAVMQGDAPRLTELSARPFHTLDNELDDRRHAHAPEAVPHIIESLLDEDAGLNAERETLRAWIARHPQLPARLLSPDGQRARAGNFEFEHGKQGWRLLHAYLPRRRPAPGSSALAAEPLRAGVTSAQVLRLQKRLNARLQPGQRLRENGQLGAGTLAALQRFQQQQGLRASGEADDATWRALDPPAPARTPQASKVSIPAWMTPAPAWLLSARATIGLFEDTRKGRHHPAILSQHATVAGGFRDDEKAWCSSFVNSMLRRNGIRGSNDPRSVSWLNWGEALPEPRLGAIVVLHRRLDLQGKRNAPWQGNHVAFYAGRKGNSLRLLGGNQLNQVSYSDYRLEQWEVLSYRWPVANAARPVVMAANGPWRLQ